MEKALVLVLGLAGGSFLGVVVSRWERGFGKKRVNWREVFGLSRWKRSCCDSCRRSLFWWENVPLLSFLFVKGRCGTCRAPIPFWYFLVELGTATIFFLAYLFWAKSGEGVFSLLVYLFISFLLFFVFVFDWRNQLIPNEVVGGLIALSLFLGFSLPAFFSGLGGVFFLLFLHFLTRGKGMGLGDVKLAFFMGLFLGWPKTGVAFYLAFLTGGIFGVIMVLLKKAKLKGKVPFGPFLVGGTFAAWWWGDWIWSIAFRWLEM